MRNGTHGVRRDVLLDPPLSSLLRLLRGQPGCDLVCCHRAEGPSSLFHAAYHSLTVLRLGPDVLGSLLPPSRCEAVAPGWWSAPISVSIILAAHPQDHIGGVPSELCDELVCIQAACGFLLSVIRATLSLLLLTEMMHLYLLNLWSRVPLS
jgi:hypothetical protein